jgi:hypothetical protein
MLDCKFECILGCKLGGNVDPRDKSNAVVIGESFITIAAATAFDSTMKRIFRAPLRFLRFLSPSLNLIYQEMTSIFYLVPLL